MLNLLKAIYSRPSKFVVEGVSVSVCVCPGTEESKVGNHNPGISCFAFFTSVLTNGGLSVCSCWPAAWNALPKSWSRGQQCEYLLRSPHASYSDEDFLPVTLENSSPRASGPTSHRYVPTITSSLIRYRFAGGIRWRLGWRKTLRLSYSLVFTAL